MAEDVRAEIVASVLEVVVREGDQIGSLGRRRAHQSLRGLEVPSHVRRRVELYSRCPQCLYPPLIVAPSDV